MELKIKDHWTAYIRTRNIMTFVSDAQEGNRVSTKLFEPALGFHIRRGENKWAKSRLDTPAPLKIAERFTKVVVKGDTTVFVSASGSTRCTSVFEQVKTNGEHQNEIKNQ